MAIQKASLIDVLSIFKQNSYPQEKVPTVEKKPLQLVLPCLAAMSLQTRTKLQKSIKGVLNCCQLQVIFKSKNKLCNNFRFKDPVPHIFASDVVYKFQCGLCKEFCYRKCVRYLGVRSGWHIGISPSTNKRVQPRKDSVVCHHLLNCSSSPTFEDSSVLCHESKKYLLELKEKLLIIRHRPSINRKVRLAPLHLFEWALVLMFAALYELL